LTKEVKVECPACKQNKEWNEVKGVMEEFDKIFDHMGEVYQSDKLFKKADKSFKKFFK